MFWICGVPGSASIVKLKAGRDRAGNQSLRNVALPEHLGRERVDREHHDEQRYATIGQDRADDDNGQDGPVARPSMPMTADTMDFEKPDSSMTFPKTEPSMKTGK